MFRHEILNIATKANWTQSTLIDLVASFIEDSGQEDDLIHYLEAIYEEEREENDDLYES